MGNGFQGVFAFDDFELCPSGPSINSEAPITGYDSDITKEIMLVNIETPPRNPIHMEFPNIENENMYTKVISIRASACSLFYSKYLILAKACR